MNIVPINIKFIKEYESKYGTLYLYKITFQSEEGQQEGFYNSKSKDQTKYKVGQETESTVETRKTEKGEMIIIKPASKNPNSPYGRQLKREQTKYSGFAMSYAKDLAIAGKIELKDLDAYTRKMFALMVELDKTLGND